MVYVWLDALTNYITGIGYDCDGESSDLFKKYWPADLHLIGKDIIRFHTIYWPIFLMALDLPLPKQVFGHPWLLQGDGKMSKSKGNVLYADELVDFFGVDAVRYFVLHEMPFENDGVITWELMVERMNSDLANTLGNLVNRTVSMANKYFGGVVADKGVAEEVDADLKAVVENTPKAVDARMDDLRVADAMTEIFNLFKRCNKYIDETMPWALAKDEAKKDRLETVLNNLIESITVGAGLLAPYMPETAEKILAQLGDGKVTEKPEILFARLDLEEVMKKVEELASAGRRRGRQYGRGRCGSYRSGAQAGDHLRRLWENAVPGRRDHCLRSGAQIQEASVLPGKSRKPDEADRVRDQGSLHPGRDGRQESHGTDQLKTCQAGRRGVRRNAAVRGRRRRQSGAYDPGTGNARRSGDLLKRDRVFLIWDVVFSKIPRPQLKK